MRIAVTDVKLSLADARAKGGLARAQALTPEERKAQAQKAARERWRGDIAKAPYSGVIHVGELDIPCCVLDDGTRLLTQFGFLSAIGRSPRPAAGRASSIEKGAPFLALDNLKPFVSEDLDRSATPILFQTDRGTRSLGYRAELLPQVCYVYLSAREAGALLPSQIKFAQACELVMRSLAHVGIAALVDQATGFQHDHPAEGLAKILEAFIAKELQPWVRTFPTAYYQELFRLRGLEYPSNQFKPQYFGALTNDILYKRLAPRVVEELKLVTELVPNGRPGHKYFQKLASNIGYPKLREHLGSVVTIMKLSKDYPEFKQHLDRLHPPYWKTVPLPLEYDSTTDTGKGMA
jgi:hypothetical protein